MPGKRKAPRRYKREDKFVGPLDFEGMKNPPKPVFPPGFKAPRRRPAT
jgi:hypothetical protein